MFKVDDGFYDHPKVRSIPRGAPRKGAVTLWTLAGSWCDRYLTDGLVPSHQIGELGATRREAEWLVAAQLWHEPGHDCDSCPDVPTGHFLYHDWPQCNDLKVDVEKRRGKARERMRKLRNGESTKPDPHDEPGADVREMFGRTGRERTESL